MKILTRILAVLCLLAVCTGLWAETAGSALADGPQTAIVLMAKSKKKKKNTASPASTVTPAPAVNEVTPSPVPEGPITDPQSIADYIFANGCLPDNFITKKEAQALGWDSRYNYLSDVAPGYSIGGDRFGNYEGILPRKSGRVYYECDCYYTGGKRNAYRIVFSNDGLVFYTEDHYNTFEEMHPSTEVQAQAP